MSEQDADVGFDSEEPLALRGAKQFVDEVLPAERAAIAARRQAAGLVGAAALEAPPGTPPTTADGLVGLALSGGGIRSAAFNMGLLQALQRRGVLRHVDYLSTVSGGGWIGATLQTLQREPGAPFPFAPRTRNEGHDGATVSHLRDRSSALMPSGAIGRFVVAATILRGQFATVLLLLPLTVLLALATKPLLFAYIRARNDARPLLVLRGVAPGAPSPRVAWWDLPWSWFTAGSRWVVVASAAWMFAGVFYAVLERPPKRRRRLERSFGWALVVAALAVFSELVPCAVIRAHHWLYGDASIPRAPDLTNLGALVASLLSLGPLSAALPRVARPLGIALATAVSLVVPCGVFLVVQAAMIHHRELFDATLTASAVVGLLVVLAVQDVNVMSLHSFYRDRLTRTFLLRRTPGGVVPDEEVSLTALNRPGTTAPYALVNTAINLQASDDRSLRGRNSDLFVFSPRFVGSPRTGFCPTELAEYATPGLDLGTAMAVSAAAAAPNMGTYTVRSVVMLMTFLNLRLGYWLPHPARLAAWHARRGSPPIDLDRRDAARRLAWLRWAPRLPSYVRELFSRLREDGSHVFLSDGGHIENTGAYELLRRRCHLVIASDAEEDPQMRFSGFAALLRFARLDLGVEVDIDLAELRPRPGGGSHRHAAFGVIRYPATTTQPAERGVLLYVKSARTGDEGELIEEYRARNPDFPHQSTADQLYDEAQFEAYRALGEHSVEGLFPDGGEVSAHRAGLAAWLESLAARLTPDASCDPAFAELRDELEEVEDLLRDPGCARYFRELYPELAADTPAPEAHPEQVSMAVSRQLHVMATVFNRLSLDVSVGWDLQRNRGWMNLFQRWAGAPTFRRHWLVAVHQEGDAFRQFCEEALGLSLGVRWRDADADDVADANIPLAAPLRAEDGARHHVACLTLGALESPPVYAARVSAGRERAVAAWGVRPGYAGALEERARQALRAAIDGGPGARAGGDAPVAR